jgi:hypothetical protein
MVQARKLSKTLNLALKPWAVGNWKNLIEWAPESPGVAPAPAQSLSEDSLPTAAVRLILGVVFPHYEA